MFKITKNFIFGILVTLFLFNILAWLAVFGLSQPRFLKVNFFDIGQGDAIFIETPQRHQILIDGGPDSTILEKLGENLPFWDRTIDLIILSHPERDHLAGLIEVLKRYKVENILWTGVVRDTAEYREWEKLVKEERAKVIIAKADQKVIASRIVLGIIHPLESLEGEFFKDSNDTSIVARLVFENNSFIFTGDIYKSGEKELIGSGVNLDSDVLKVSHHGSKTSSSEEFIAKVLPEMAIISVGRKNSYGHPHQEALETLNKYGIRILRTDLDGDIKIISDGKTTNKITN